MYQIFKSIFAVCCVLACTLVVNATAAERDWSTYPMVQGEFEGNWDSLDQYECPEWFRDAKLGIWAIIGPQAVPLQGDWYARHMYEPGHRQYEHHVKAYGHPSEFGYKDIIKKFNPIRLDYDELVGRYKKAGAKYAVILAVHHDNFDLWDSKHHEWNSVKMGPKRDLVGEFRDATHKHDIRFGVTTHLARSYSWLQTSHGADKEGPMKGVPYDGADPKYESLYHPSFTEYARYPQSPPEAWEREWYLRVTDLINSYKPDLMYFDGGYPFDDGAAGKRLVAHYYNANTQWNDGNNEAVMCIKKWAEGSGHGVFRDGTCVQDIERGAADKLADLPWQTDTCIGGWYYNERKVYKSPELVVQMLLDIVSKNGNLLLNIPVHPDGWIDEKEIAILDAIGAWMEINGPGIYGTRPWTIYGESSEKEKKVDSHFNEKSLAYGAEDIRFMQKDGKLYAFALGWPKDGVIKIKALATNPEGPKNKITTLRLLGHKGDLKWTQNQNGLEITMPKTPPCEFAYGFEVIWKNLQPIRE